MNRFGVTSKFITLLIAAVCATLFCGVFLGAGLGVAVLLNGMALLLTAIDFFAATGAKHFKAERILPNSFEQKVEALVELQVYCNLPRRQKIRIADSPPKNFRFQESINGEAKETPATISYTVTPSQRGAFHFGNCYIEVVGPCGFSVKRLTLECPGEARVYPNLEPMRHYRLLASRKQLSRDDLSVHHIRGIGTDFAGLREYTPDDDWRKINWKATARAAKLMTNVYDVEKNRDVIIAVDTGRWMQSPMGDVTRLDRALELAAVLMQVALSAGDRVGLALFDTTVNYYLPPGKGVAQMRHFLQGLYGAHTQLVQSSLPAMSGALRQRLSKRAFICVLTYLDSPAEAAQAVADLLPVSKRHSLFIASLTDLGLDALINTKATEPQDLYLKAAAAYRKMAGLGAVETLVRNGIGACAAEPGELLTRSVRYYLTVKQKPW
ncbi:MAG: DUF58 domain-containing protein [Eubacteriaceae bacterium]|nr:DUF58 domain-containing protein [Eubacteriaceae bacterium]